MTEDDLFDDNGRLTRVSEQELWELVRDWATKAKGSEIPDDEPTFYSASLFLDKVFHAGPPALRISVRDWCDWLTDEERAEFSQKYLDPLLDGLAALAERKLAEA